MFKLGQGFLGGVPGVPNSGEMGIGEAIFGSAIRIGIQNARWGADPLVDSHGFLHLADGEHQAQARVGPSFRHRLTLA